MKSCSRHTYSLPIKTPFKHYRFVLLTPDHSFLWTVTSMFQYCCFLRRKFDLIDTNKIPNINIKRRFKISPEDVTTHHLGQTVNVPNTRESHLLSILVDFKMEHQSDIFLLFWICLDLLMSIWIHGCYLEVSKTWIYDVTKSIADISEWFVTSLNILWYQKLNCIRLEGPEDPHRTNSRFLRSRDPAHASLPLAQTPWGLTGRAGLQAGAQQGAIMVSHL